jgi:hypothetical protein
MPDVTELRKALNIRILEGPGTASGPDRRAAYDNSGPVATKPLIDKVARFAYKVTDEDVAAAKAAGLTEDQIFELSVCAAIGQSTRQLENALAALEAATKEG